MSQKQEAFLRRASSVPPGILGSPLSNIFFHYQFPLIFLRIIPPPCPYPLFHPELQRKKKSTAAILLPFPQGYCFYQPCPMALHLSPGYAANPLPGGAERVKIILQECSNATGIKTLALWRGAWEQVSYS